jgi:hypothetical protein
MAGIQDSLAMGKRANNPSTGQSIANAAERQAQAAQSAIGFVANTVTDANAAAILLIDNMLIELYLVFAWLEEFGYDINQFAVLTNAFHLIKYSLAEVGPLATINAVEALHGFWLHNKAFPDGPSHEKCFKDAGLEALSKECFRTVQDAIAMSMIFYPDTYQEILGMDLDIAMMSRLQHSYFIQKRYLRGVGEKLLLLGELPSNAIGKRSVQRREEAAEIKAAEIKAEQMETWPLRSKQPRKL